MLCQLCENISLFGCNSFANSYWILFFSRNLLCVYSKKHMFDDPELAEMKRIANTKSLKELAMLLRYALCPFIANKWVSFV